MADSPKAEVLASAGSASSPSNGPFKDSKDGWWAKMDAGYLNDNAADGAKKGSATGFVPQYNMMGMKNNYTSMFADEAPAEPAVTSQPPTPAQEVAAPPPSTPVVTASPVTAEVPPTQVTQPAAEEVNAEASKLGSEGGSPNPGNGPFKDTKDGWWAKMDAGFMNTEPVGSALDQKKPGGFVSQYSSMGLKSNYTSMFGDEVAAAPQPQAPPAANPAPAPVPALTEVDLLGLDELAASIPTTTTTPAAAISAGDEWDAFTGAGTVVTQTAQAVADWDPFK